MASIDTLMRAGIFLPIGSGSATRMRNTRSWIVLASLLGYAATGCGNGSGKAVRLDLTKLLGGGARQQGQEYVWLKPVARVKALPPSVKARIGREIANPGGAFNPGDVEFLDRVFHIPDRRLLFAGLSEKYCLVHYEYGGIAHGYRVVIFEISGKSAVPVWMHGGGLYASLADFVSETDPDALTNEVEVKGVIL